MDSLKNSVHHEKQVISEVIYGESHPRIKQQNNGVSPKRVEDRV